MHNLVILVGNLGKDPEMRYTPSGQAVTNFNVATNRKYTDSNGQQIKETIWWRVSTWGKRAEVCNQYLKKGSKVYVEGRMTCDPKTGGPRIWISEQDGSAHASFELSASNVTFLSSRGDNEQSGEPVRTYEENRDADPDLPF